MAASEQYAPTESRMVPRLARNVGWLLGGKGLTGLFSLFYLAIAARALGPVQFGIFTLVLTYAQLFANLVQFQSWKGVIRFGAVHLSDGQQGALARVLGFCAALDWVSAILGAVLAVAGAYLVAPLFEWPADIQNQAAIFSAALLLTSGATASGMLRLFDRFDLLAYSEACSPTVRLIGAVTAWLAGGKVEAFLAVWALSAIAQFVATWVCALRIRRTQLALHWRGLVQAVRENRGLWRFMWQTSLSSSLAFLWLQAGTLAVGAYAGPRMAGGYRLADRVASAMARPTETITRALYPELARLVASNDRATLRRLFRRTLVISGALALVIVVVAATLGSTILHAMAGRRFEFAEPFLVVLAIAAAIDIAGFVLEPFHNAHGRSGRVLRSRIVAAVVYVISLAVLLPEMGAIGAAYASAITAAVLVGQLAHSAYDIFRHAKASEPVRQGSASAGAAAD